MKKLGRLFVRNATWKGVGVLGLMIFAFNVLFVMLGADLEQTPDTLGFVGGDALVTCIEAMGPNGIEAYQPIALFDLSYPFVYATFLSFLLALLSGVREGGEQVPVGSRMMLPWLAAVADWVENVSVLRYLDDLSYAVFMDATPEPSGLLLSVWSAGHNLKWGLLGLVIVLLLAEVWHFLRRRDRR